MSVWRRKAIELFPDLRRELEDPSTNPYILFFELLPRCRLAHSEKNEAELGRIYGFAAWCARQNAKDLWNAAGVSFYEHIVDGDDAPSDFHRWVDPDVFDDIAGLLEAAMGEEEFGRLKSGYESSIRKMGGRTRRQGRL